MSPGGSRGGTVVLLVLGAIAWAAAMAASAWLSLRLAGWQTEASVRQVARIFFAGGLLAYLPAVPVVRLAVGTRRPQARFAAHVVALAAATVIATALAFALVYRAYYSAWHAPAFTFGWFIESAFTMAAALYQFAVAGLRLYFPIGLPALFLFGLLHVKIAR